MKLVALKLDKNGNGYVAQPIGKTIKLPTSLDMIPTFFEVGLPLIQHMKVLLHVCSFKVMARSLNKCFYYRIPPRRTP